MDYALQVHEAKYVFPMPDGLRELTSDIIREVLRHQPEHINGFIADYLETMLVVREHARDTAEVVCDVVQEGRFFDELYRTKNVTRQQTNDYVTKIQAAWRGYVVRRKLAEWLKKKKKTDEEKERKRTLRIEELLEGMGITYEEATRAADLIQTAYRESKRGKWFSADGGEIWLGENIPFGQRVREQDRAQGRFAKWNMEDFTDFFEIDQEGAIKYDWPRVGNLRKVLREDVPEDAKIVNFFAMRDLQGQEQYSYIIKPQTKREKLGTAIGFLIPVSRALVLEFTPEVVFVNPENARRMGNYTYVFKETVDREEVSKFDELFKAQAKASKKENLLNEFDYDPHWVLPRVLVRIKQEYLNPMDDEVVFHPSPSNVVCEGENYVFKAESLEETAKLVRFILREECMTVEEALAKATLQGKETGRIFLVDSSACPQFVQKIEIIPESTSEADTDEMALFEYIFVPLHYPGRDKLPKEEQIMKIFMTRFQGYHTDYQGSLNLKNKVFIMGPKLAAFDGKALTFESFFWNDFGEDAWHKLLYDVMCNKYEIDGEVEEEGEKVSEKPGELDYRSKGFDEVVELKGEEKSKTSGTVTATTEEYTEVAKSGMPSIREEPPTEKSVEGEAARKVESKGEDAPELAAPEKAEEKSTEDRPDLEPKEGSNE